MSEAGRILTAFATQSGYWPTSGTAKTLGANLDFTNSVSINFDLTLETELGRIETVQAMFVDNSANADPVTFLFGVTQLRVVIPAGQQGTFPVFASADVKCTAASVGGVVVPVFFLNTPMPFAVWGPIAVSSSGLVVNTLQTVTLAKTALGVTGADQQLLAANAARKTLQLMAPSGNAGVVRVAWGGVTGALGSDYEITPGGVWQMPANSITGQSVHIIGTNGDNIIAYEGT